MAGVDADMLVDIELIKQLKARYFRLLDERQWELWRAIFTEDCRVQFDHARDRVLLGPDAVVRFSQKVLTDTTSIHFGHMPEITIESTDRARGVWSMFDYLEGPGFTINGYGRYEEEYAKGVDGAWRIASLRLIRTRVDQR
jgi:hypothetical protein